MMTRLGLWIWCCLGLLAVQTAQADLPAAMPPAVWQEDPASSRLQGQTQKLGSPNVIMFREIQAQRYAVYEAKTRDLHRALLDAYAYLQSLNGQMPEMQRLSALSEEAWLDWNTADKSLSDADRQYKSYRYMKQGALLLHNLSQYWIEAEAVRPVYRGTQKDMDDDRSASQQSQAKIEETVGALKNLDEIKRNLNDELPY